MSLEEQLTAVATTLQAVVNAQLALTNAQTRTQETIADMAASIGKYVDAAEARTKRLEENLDGLIRAITAEHSNGKTKH
jgi:ornithine carbamoyltransferase